MPLAYLTLPMCPRANGSHTLLLVDDDPSVLTCTRRCLEKSGYRVHTASDPAYVLESGRLDGVDLILLDFRMPGMTGLDLLERLRGAGYSAKCILLSAFVNDEVRQRAAELGVDRVLDKPVEVALLRDSLAELLAGSGARIAAGADVRIR